VFQDISTPRNPGGAHTDQRVRPAANQHRSANRRRGAGNLIGASEDASGNRRGSKHGEVAAWLRFLMHHYPSR
jgi:hypothetical protein